jgi:hypothetical protein
MERRLAAILVADVVGYSNRNLEHCDAGAAPIEVFGPPWRQTNEARKRPPNRTQIKTHAATRSVIVD